MADYKLSNQAKDDSIRVHQFGVKQFGEKQADLYFDTLFECLDVIALQPFAFVDVSYIKPGYRGCVCGPHSIFYRVKKEIAEIMTTIGREDLTSVE